MQMHGAYGGACDRYALHEFSTVSTKPYTKFILSYRRALLLLLS